MYTEEFSPVSSNFSPSAGARPLKTSLINEDLGWEPFSLNGQREQRKNVGDVERFTSVVAGSVLTVLGLSRRSLPGLLVAATGTALAYRGTTGHCSVYEALGIDSVRDQELVKKSPFEFVQSFAVKESPELLYSFWRNLEQLPTVLKYIESVKEYAFNRSHWVAKPFSASKVVVEWNAEITRDEPNRLIAWRSLLSSAVDTDGEISFIRAPADRGTVVKVRMKYRLPGGKATHLLAKLFGRSPKALIREDLRSFKRFIELGEVLTTEGQAQGSGLREFARRKEINSQFECNAIVNKESL